MHACSIFLSYFFYYFGTNLPCHIPYLTVIYHTHIHTSLVFRMVEAEEEYLEQLQLMVSCFLRPFKMAASSQKPPCNHDEVNSIFLNAETVMFLHQIFLKGLTARMECWPTLVLGMMRFRCCLLWSIRSWSHPPLAHLICSFIRIYIPFVWITIFFSCDISIPIFMHACNVFWCDVT